MERTQKEQKQIMTIIHAINILEQAREIETNTTLHNIITAVILTLEKSYQLTNNKKNKSKLGYFLIDNSIFIGKYYNTGNCDYEIKMEWEFLLGNYVPRLKIFNDAWCGLIDMIPLFIELSKHNNKNINQNQFIEILKKLNFENLDK